jgi:murein DD-endopeptidase MepM/ murein hydrolase activator NlpD
MSDEPRVAGAPPRRGPFRLGALAAALTATLALLCCGGGAAGFFLTELGGDQKDPVTLAGQDCSLGQKVSITGDMPRFAEYGDGQLRNAAVIIKVGQDMGVPARGWVVALATAMQESALRNLANSTVPASLALPHEGVGADHDSLGLFQQRPSWGSVSERLTPSYAARRFYEKMIQVPAWQQRPVTVVAQRVQVSAYPDAYARHEELASRIVDALAGGAARTVQIAGRAVCDAASGAQIAASGWTAPIPGRIGSGFRTAGRPGHDGVDIAAPKRVTPIHAAATGRVLVARCDPDHRGRLDCDRDGYAGKGGCGWFVDMLHAGGNITRYCHMVERPLVRPGQLVQAGEVIGRVGSGNSSGPHLHFEVHVAGDRSSRGAINPVPFMRQRGAPLDGTA